MIQKPHKIELLLFLIAIALVGVGVYYLASSITGFIIKEFSYADDLNLVVTASGNYTWPLKNIGGLKSVKLEGRVTTYGKARVYIESNGIRYLIFDSTRLWEKKETEKNESSSLITGFVVKEDKKDKDKEKDENKTESDEDKKKKNSKPDWIGNDGFIVNGTTVINLSQHFADEDNDSLIYSASEVEGLEIAISREILTIRPTSDNDFNTTITFTASDGIDTKSETVELIVIVKKELPIMVNRAPIWNSNVDIFVINGTTTINLSQHFIDEDNDALSFRFSDAIDISESISNSVLTLSTIKDNFNATIIITVDDGNLSTSKEVKLIVPLTMMPQINPPINITKTITVNLIYKAGTIYDANDNGEESINGVVDLTVEDTKLSWDADKSKLCTRWEVYNAEDEKLTTFCNGNEECCSFFGLLPKNEQWNDVYYSTFGKDGAGYNNIVYAQVLYYDVNLSIDNPRSEIYYSGWGNLSAKFFEEETKFLDICLDSCYLTGLNKSSYNLIFEIEDDAILRIEKIRYNLLVDVVNNPPLLLQNFSIIDISKDKNVTIDLSQHFADPDGDTLAYDYYMADNITILFENNIATIVPDKGVQGNRFTYITANDSESIVVSNIFMVNIREEKPEIKFFEIRSNADKKLALFDSLGNLKISGNLIQHIEPSADENDFAVQNSSGGLKLVITNPEGNVQIKGSLSENQVALVPTPNSFILQDNRTGETIAYVNSTGSLFLKGVLAENVLFE